MNVGYMTRWLNSKRPPACLFCGSCGCTSGFHPCTPDCHTGPCTGRQAPAGTVAA